MPATTFATNPASGSRQSISYIPEAVWGDLPSPSDMTFLRSRPATFNLAKQILTSEEVREDRMIETLRHGNRSVSATIPVEMGYGPYWDLLESALFGEFTAGVGPQTLKAGTTFKSMSMEQRFNDIARYRLFTGMVGNTMSMRWAPNSMVVTTFGMVGRLTQGLSAVSVDAAPTAASTRNPFDSFNGTLDEGGASIAIVTALELNLDNGLDPVHVLMQEDPETLNIGNSNLTGTLSALFASESLYNKWVNEVESSIEITMIDVDDPTYTTTVYIPRLKYSGGDIPPTGTGRFVVNMPFQALRDPVEGTNLVITRSNP